MHVVLKMSCKIGGKVTLVASVELLFFTVKSCSIILGTGAASAAVLAN